MTSKIEFKDYSRSDPLFYCRIRGMDCVHNQAPSYLVIFEDAAKCRFSWKKYVDPVTPEMKSWLRATFSKRGQELKPYHYLYDTFYSKQRIGIGFYEKDDAMLFMLVFNGE